MDPTGQSAEILIDATILSGPAIGLDNLSDSTTFAMLTNPAFVIFGSLQGGSQSPSVSSTTTPVEGGIPDMAFVFNIFISHFLKIIRAFRS